jgi:hypothetical protein
MFARSPAGADDKILNSAEYPCRNQVRWDVRVARRILRRLQ